MTLTERFERPSLSSESDPESDTASLCEKFLAVVLLSDRAGLDLAGDCSLKLSNDNEAVICLTSPGKYHHCDTDTEPELVPSNKMVAFHLNRKLEESRRYS